MCDIYIVARKQCRSAWLKVGCTVGNFGIKGIKMGPGPISFLYQNGTRAHFLHERLLMGVVQYFIQEAFVRKTLLDL